jgi:hypothetical protein
MLPAARCSLFATTAANSTDGFLGSMQHHLQLLGRAFATDCVCVSFEFHPPLMQPSQRISSDVPKHSSGVAVVDTADILLEVDCDTPRQTASHVLSSEGNDCRRSIIIDVSWIRLRDQRWFCGWIWSVDAASSSMLSQTSSTSTALAASKPVSVSDLAGEF